MQKGKVYRIFIAEHKGEPMEKRCTCPKKCDCQKPPTHISNMCPEHNDYPISDPNCPEHG